MENAGARLASVVYSDLCWIGGETAQGSLCETPKRMRRRSDKRAGRDMHIESVVEHLKIEQDCRRCRAGLNRRGDVQCSAVQQGHT